MPIYEFKCADCGEITVEMRKSDDDSSPPCEKCGSKNTRRLFSSFSGGKTGPRGSSCGHTGGG